MSIKASKNFSFSKSSEAIGTIVARTLNKMARHLNASIQKGIDTSTDIHGNKFKRLSEDSTLPIRNKRKHGFTPLDTMQTTAPLLPPPDKPSPAVTASISPADPPGTIIMIPPSQLEHQPLHCRSAL